MIYIFDTNALVQMFRYYYPKRFPTFWQRFDGAVDAGLIVSAREVLNEIEQGEDALSEWARQHREFFQPPTAAELGFVGEIFKIPHFQALVTKQNRLEGKPVADPFVIAKAKALEGCVVTQEGVKPNASKIPNVCEHFSIPCCDLEGFMERENWTF